MLFWAQHVLHKVKYPRFCFKIPIFPHFELVKKAHFTLFAILSTFLNFSCFNFNWIFESLHISEIIHFSNKRSFLIFLFHPQFHILEFLFYRHLQFLDFSISSTFLISSYLNQIEPLFLIDPGSEWFYNQKHVLQSHQSRKLSPAERGRVVQILSG